MNPSVELELRYGANNYDPLPVTLTRGEGVFLWDDAGKRYFDLMSAYSAVSFGHCHPQLVKVLQEQAGRLGVVSRAFYTDRLGHFLERACELTGFDKALPMNSGAEAVETALKAARKWAYTVKGIRPNKAEIISCEGNFHGRTLAIISMSSESQYQEGFGPLLPGLRTIRYGKLQDLELAITHNTAAFIVEPIQGEGGIVVPPPGYLKACAELCKKNKVLFLCDEIQTGLGRTGKMLACEHEGVRPDGVMLGKALGGGLLPVSLFLACKEVMNVFHPGDHGSTFGGNPLAAAVGTAALKILTQENLLTQAAELGQYFIDALRNLASPVIREVRGKGLLIGIEISPQFSARQVCLTLLKHGILTKETHKTVVRLAPPLIITKAQLDEVLVHIKTAFEEIEPTQAEATDVEVTLPKRVEEEPVARSSKPRVRKNAAPKTETLMVAPVEPSSSETVIPTMVAEVSVVEAPNETPAVEMQSAETPLETPSLPEVETSSAAEEQKSLEEQAEMSQGSGQVIGAEEQKGE